jgi:hypothetical protein
LNVFHTEHADVVKTKSVTRSYIWWPSLDSDIESFVKACKPCVMLKGCRSKAELIPWTVPEKAWSRVHIDFGGLIMGVYIFMLVDACSKWVEVFITKQLTAQTVIEKLMEVFARFGLVEVIVLDGGPAFIAERFKEFMITNSIKHIISPPGHPSTNGQAENTIRTVKTSIKATIEESKAKSANPNVNETVLNHLLNYRSTKHTVTNETPAKLLLGREVQTVLDCIRPSTVRDTIINHKMKQIEHHKGKRYVEFEMNQDHTGSRLFQSKLHTVGRGNCQQENWMADVFMSTS